MNDTLATTLGAIVVIGGVLWTMFVWMAPFLILGWIGRCIIRATTPARTDPEPRLNEDRRRNLERQLWLEGAN